MNSKDLIKSTDNMITGTKLKDIISGYLMLGDKEVMYFNFDDYTVHIISKELVPYQLTEEVDELSHKPETHINMISSFRDWLSSRIVAMATGNYKQLMAYFNLLQTSDKKYRSKVALNCRAISMEDAYWVKYENEVIEWKDVCPYNKHLKDIVTVSLSSTIPSITGNIEHPNLTMSGTFPKTWIRDNGKVYLIKAGKTSDDINAIVEIMASDLLGCINFGNIEFVKYSEKIVDIDGTKRCCSICESYYKEGMSVVKADDIIMYKGINKLTYIIRTNNDILTYIANMVLVDYVLANTDRHPSNYAFYINNQTGNIESCVPLYDFNYAFISDLNNVDVGDTLCQIFNDGRSIISVVYAYLYNSNIRFSRNLLNEFCIKYSKYPEVINGIMNRIQLLENISARKILV